VNGRPTRLRTAFGAMLVAAFAALAAWGVVQGRSHAAREGAAARPAAEARVSLAGGVPVITLGAAAQRTDGIAIATLRNAPHRRQLRTYGSVLDAAPLTELHNRYDNARAQLDIAQAKLAATAAAAQRARKLYHDRQNISTAALQAAEAAYRVDRAGVAAAQSQLRTLAVTARQRWGAVLGAAIVDDRPLLQRLTAQQEFLVQVTLQPGASVAPPPREAAMQLADGARVKLRFVSWATRTDPRLQGMSLLFTAPAGTGLLPGMNVVALVAAGPAVAGVVVPATAVVWQDGRAWAYFRSGGDRFARRPVATAWRTAGGYVVEGISDGSEVVVAGAQMLLSEEARASLKKIGDED
jgi:hypothetical protein